MNTGAAISIRRGGGFAWQIPFSRKELVRILAAMRRACGHEDMPVELVLADDAVVSEANAAFLDCIGPTNILSFPPYFGPCLGSTLPGQGLLALSLDGICRECLLYGQDPAEHTLHLLAHGMAHLTGLDHGEAMTEREAGILRAGLAAWREGLEKEWGRVSNS